MGNWPFSIIDVAHACKIHVKSYKVESEANCPFCLDEKGQPDSKGHLGLNVQKNVWHCNRCHRHGTMLQMYQLIYGVDGKTAYADMLKYIGKTDYTERKAAYVQQIQSQKVYEMAPVEHCMKVNYDLFSLLNLSDMHKRSLIKRGLTPLAIETFGYRSMPQDPDKRLSVVERLLSKYQTLKGIPGFYVDKNNGKWDMFSPAGILVPCRNLHGDIQGFQIRLDNVEKRKYRSFSSKDFNEGTGAKAWCHWPLRTKKSSELYITEGGLKADVASVLSGGQPFMSLPGVNAQTTLEMALCEAKQLGVTRIYECFDMDKFDNPNVKLGLDRLQQTVKRVGFEFVPKVWDKAYKGVDDYLYWWRHVRPNENNTNEILMKAGT